MTSDLHGLDVSLPTGSICRLGLGTTVMLGLTGSGWTLKVAELDGIVGRKTGYFCGLRPPLPTSLVACAALPENTSLVPHKT